MPERLARLTERVLMPATCWTWVAWVGACAATLAALRLRDTVAGLRSAEGCSPACPCQVDLDPEDLPETEEEAAAACAMDPGCLERPGDCGLACPWEQWVARQPELTR